MPAPYDYSSLIQAGQNLVPDVQAELAKTSYMNAQAKEAQAQAAEATQKVDRAQQFQQDIHTYDGTPTAASRLIVKYPEFADHLKQGWDVQNDANKQADLQTMGEIYSAATGGNWKLAKQLAHSRADAEKAAGHSDPAYDASLGVLDAAADGDPTQQKVVLNMLGTSIAAVTGADHFASVYGALTKGKTPELRNVGPGENVISIDPDTGKPTEVYKSPYFKDADGNIAVRDGAEGGGQASPPGTAATPSAAPGGFDHAVNTVLANEGGYNPSDMNGAPVNFGINQKANPGVDVKNLTRDQAKQIYHDKYWVPSGAENLPESLQTPYFDVYIRNPKIAKAAMAQSQGDPAKFMQISSTYFQNLAKKPSGQKYAEAWAARDANNTAIATGGAPQAAAPGQPSTDAPPPGYHWISHKSQARTLTPQEASARGLSTAKVYEMRPDGTVTAVGDSTSTDGGGPLKPDALEAATVGYIKTGKMPAGMGGQALKNQILNYVPAIMDRHGLTPDDMPSIQQQFGADSAAFKQRVGQLSYMRQSIGKLNQHAQDLSGLIKAIPLQGKFTPFNAATQGVERKFSNDALAQLSGGLPLFEGEVARVMTGNPNSGSGQLSDNARHEFDILHSTQATKSKINAMNRIMKMVEESVTATRNETGTLKSRIGGGIEVYAGGGPKPQAPNQDQGWVTLPSGLKIRKIR